MFDPTRPIERARTPPSSWYLDPQALAREKERVFRRTWQAAGPLEHVLEAGQYMAGAIADEPFVVVRGGDGQLRSFFNVCRHHASCIVDGRGSAERLVCPYHGWTYDLDGRLRSAPRMAGVEAFDREKLGLVPMDVAVWGPVVFVRPERSSGPALEEQMRPLEGRLDVRGLRFVTRRSWEIECNWKVYVDNYLDGGYHVAHLHRGLAAQLDLDAYRTEVHEHLSIQLCPTGSGDEAEGDSKARLGAGALYAFVYPNFMLNRYGPILDTNWVVPLGAERTLTVFDYWFDTDVAERDPGFVEQSIAASARVQEEDVSICEAVQRGLRSSAYDTGLYAPRVEQAAYQFHRRLAADLGAR